MWYRRTQSQAWDNHPRLLRSTASPRPAPSPLLRRRAQAIHFRQEAAEAFAQSRCLHIDMAKLYALVIRHLPETIDGPLPPSVPPTYPKTPNEPLR